MSVIASESREGRSSKLHDFSPAAATDALPQQRNHAPGIPDRRRSLRPSRVKASPRRSLNKSSGISIRVAMADHDGDAEEVKVIKEKDDSDDEKPVRWKNLVVQGISGQRRY